MPGLQALRMRRVSQAPHGRFLAGLRMWRRHSYIYLDRFSVSIYTKSSPNFPRPQKSCGTFLGAKMLCSLPRRVLNDSLPGNVVGRRTVGRYEYALVSEYTLSRTSTPARMFFKRTVLKWR